VGGEHTSSIPLNSMPNSVSHNSTKFLKMFLGLPGKKRYQFCPIQFYRNPPVGAQRYKIKSRLIIGTPRHHGITLFDPFLNLIPDMVSHLGRIVSHIDARANFQQPYCQPATQSWRSIFKNDDQHRLYFLDLE